MKALKNAGFALVGSIAGIPLQILGGALAARILGPDLFGSYSFAVTFSYFFACLAEGGLSIVATRELARRRDESGAYLTCLLVLKLVLSLGCFGLMAIAAWLWRLEPAQFRLLLIVGLGNFFSSFCIFLVGMARACERMKIEGIINFAQALTFVAILGVFTLSDNSRQLEAVSLCFMSSYLLTAMLGTWLLRSMFGSMSPFDPTLARTLARESLTVAIGWVILLIYSRAGVVVLESVSNHAEVGYFNAALRLGLNLGVVPYILAGAWMPHLSRSVASRDEYLQGALSLMKYLLIAGFLLTIPLGLAAEGVVVLMYGREFEGAVRPFAITMAAMFLFFMAFGPKTCLESMGKQSGWGRAAGAGLVVNVMLTAWLAPRYGANGASLALLGANLTIAMLAFVSSSSFVSWRGMWMRGRKIFVGAALMVGGTWLLLPVSWFLAGCAGAIVFLTYLVFVNEIRLVEVNKLIFGQAGGG